MQCLWIREVCLDDSRLEGVIPLGLVLHIADALGFSLVEFGLPIIVKAVAGPEYVVDNASYVVFWIMWPLILVNVDTIVD